MEDEFDRLRAEEAFLVAYGPIMADSAQNPKNHSCGIRSMAPWYEWRSMACLASDVAARGCVMQPR